MNITATLEELRQLAEDIVEGTDDYVGGGIINTGGGAFVNGNVHNSGGINIYGGSVGSINKKAKGSIEQAQDLTEQLFDQLLNSNRTVSRATQRAYTKLGRAWASHRGIVAYRLLIFIETVEESINVS